MRTLALLLTLAQAVPAAVTPQAPSPAAPVAPAQSDYVIGIQDVLNVTVFGEPDASRAGVTVDSDGTIDCPYIGRVKASGQTTRALEQDIKQRLSKGLFVNPSVTVEIVKYRSKTVTVQGMVRMPGEFKLEGNVSIMSVLAQAGSMTPDAGSYVVITRYTTSPGTGTTDAEPVAQQIRVPRRDLESGRAQTITLQDRDTIFVPKAETVFVLGYVRQTGPIVYEEGLTVERALALAGGATERAGTGRIMIERNVNGKVQKIKAKMSDLVQPNDTIRVPQRIL
jgi:polysaccharide biosynthesis/export protein